MKITEKTKVQSKNGVAIGKMGSNNSIVQNNKKTKTEWPWGIIISAIITGLFAIVAAVIMAK